MSPTTWLQRYLRRPFVSLALCLLPLGLGLGIHDLTRSHPRADAAVTQTGITIDPRLVLHAQSVPFAAELSGGAYLTGTLYPGLPGPNTLHMRVHIANGSRATNGHVRITAVMPGMTMTPQTATLTARNGEYAGVLSLSMFGSYRARIIAVTPSGSYSGNVTLSLPFSLPPANP